MKIKLLFPLLALVLAIGVLVPVSNLALANDTQTIHVKQSTLNDVQGTYGHIYYWHFVINQIDKLSNVPASIHVTWDNGIEADVPLLKYTGKTAHYETTLYHDETQMVTDATAVIYCGWHGQFNLSHVQCCGGCECGCGGAG